MSKTIHLAIHPHIASIRPYVPGKPTEEVERELGLRETVKLASNENPLGPSPRAVEAMRAAAAGTHRYPDGGAFYLKQRLARDLDVEPEALIVGNGSTEIVEMLAKVFLPPDGESVVSEGAFIMYKIASLAASGSVTATPMTPDLRHDVRAMTDAVSDRTRLLFVANPNNPTGTRIDRDELQLLLGGLPDSVLVVIDEAYSEYIDAPDYPDGLDELRSGRNVVVLRTFSKIHGLAGARVGYAVAPPEVVAALEKVRSPFNTNSFGQHGALAALDDHEHASRSRLENARELARVQAALRERSIDFVPSCTNFVLTQTGLPGGVAYEGLLHKGVIVRPMAGYGFADHVRVSIGTAAENERFLNALDEIRQEAGIPGA